MNKAIYKQIEMDLLLKELQVLSLKNKDEFSFVQTWIQLMEYGIPYNEQRKDVSSVFPTLVEINQYNDKMLTFVSPEHPYFCQFLSKNRPEVNSVNPVILYIPLKANNIEKMIQRIFSFININNIEHRSKLAKETRIDNLVIRVYSKEDAEKIINYVNGDKELVENIYEPSIFSISEGKVGIAMDRTLSYNNILAKYIYSYICLENGRQGFVSIEGLKEFIKDNLSSLYKKEDISEQIMMCEKENIRDLPGFLQALEEITILILDNIEGKNKNDLFHYFDEINRKDYNDEKRKSYEMFDYLTMQVENTKLLEKVFYANANKYGYSNARSAINNYRLSGEEEYITKDTGARDMVSNSKSFRTYLSLIDLEEAFQTLIPNVKETNIKMPEETILEEACKITYLKCQTPEKKYCGEKQIASLLIRLQNGNYNLITRDNGARTMVEENINPEDVKDIIKRTLESKGYIIENENDIYELYVSHIKYLCEQEERGRRNVKK